MAMLYINMTGYKIYTLQTAMQVLDMLTNDIVEPTFTWFWKNHIHMRAPSKRVVKHEPQDLKK